MRTIHKFILEPETKIETHSGAKFLCLQMQNGQPCVWFEVDTNQPKLSFSVMFFGTGHEIPDNAKEFLGTIQVNFGLVFHAYILE